MKTLTPIKIIRKMCLDCLGSYRAVRECADTKCDAWEYRLGTNPRRRNIGGNPHLTKKGL